MGAVGGAVARFRSRRLARAVVCMAAFGIPVVVLAFGVRQQFDPLIAFDQYAIKTATQWTRDADLTAELVMLQRVSQPVVVYSLATLVVVWAWLARKMRGRALWAFTTMMVSWGVGAVSKLMVQRARPVLDAALPHAQGYSFPSGHALNITVAASALLVLLWPLLSAVGRWVAVGVAVVVVVVVGLDRIFLGAHFPSDVVAGFVLGLGLMVSSWIGFVGPTAAISSRGPSHLGSSSGPSSSEAAPR